MRILCKFATKEYDADAVTSYVKVTQTVAKDGRPYLVC